MVETRRARKAAAAKTSGTDSSGSGAKFIDLNDLHKLKKKSGPPGTFEVTVGHITDTGLMCEFRKPIIYWCGGHHRHTSIYRSSMIMHELMPKS
jgi:hypothetical protein